MISSNITTTGFQPEPKICEVGGHGVLLPFFDDEQNWDTWARAFIYLLFLGWCFLGVAIISDIFMEAVEAVTSKRRKWTLNNGQVITTKVWNDTVANLSLMALGSSAPEIMLNVIEICLRDFYSGDLGPSTIVGSAAFNLMVIIAVCVMVIPEGESRTIESVEPFVVTAFFSIFAYLWMVFVLSISSPNMVTIPEAVITFLFFPLLITIAYMADVGVFSCHKENTDDDENVLFIQNKVMEAGYELTVEETKIIARMKTAELQGHRSWAASRLDASPVRGHGIAEKELAIGFVSQKHAYSPKATSMTLKVEKVGANEELVRNTRVMFEYRTCDGLNMRSDDGDYISSTGFGEILPGQQYVEISVTRKPGMPGRTGGTYSDEKVERKRSDSVLKEDQKDQEAGWTKCSSIDSSEGFRTPYFHVELVHATKMAADQPHQTITKNLAEEAHRHGTLVHINPEARRTQVAITDQIQGAGKLCVYMLEVDVPFPAADTMAKVKVRRTVGCEGDIACRYYCEEVSAKAGIDFLPVEGELFFAAGVCERTIEVPVMKKNNPDSQEKFLIILDDLAGWPSVVLASRRMSTVTIFEEENFGIVETNKVLRALDSVFNVNVVVENARDWADQFVGAFNPRGGDEEDAEQANVTEWTMHFIALPWKLLFAFTPPPSYMGGWFCFSVSLLMIGGVTTLIADLATLLGCVLNIHGSITAITIVALGTSLPDTLASKVAAVEDPTADAAIGNVTGSNSVNVFLGLGLPWVTGSIYWHFKGKTPEWEYRYPEQSLEYAQAGLVVLAGDLSFSVGCFTLCAVCVLAVLFYRRTNFEAELGGPTGVKTNTGIFLVLLWIFYVSLASWKVINGAVSTGKCVMAIIVGLLGVTLGMALIAGVINFFTYQRTARRNEFKELFEEVQAAHDPTWACTASVAHGHVAGQPRLSLKAGARLSLINPAHEPALGKGKAGAGMFEPLFSAAPQLSEGLRLKTPEAVAAFRKHLEALNVVCSSLEAHVSGSSTASTSSDQDCSSASKGKWAKPHTSLSPYNSTGQDAAEGIEFTGPDADACERGDIPPSPRNGKKLPVPGTSDQGRWGKKQSHSGPSTQLKPHQPSQSGPSTQLKPHQPSQSAPSAQIRVGLADDASLQSNSAGEASTTDTKVRPKSKSIVEGKSPVVSAQGPKKKRTRKVVKNTTANTTAPETTLDDAFDPPGADEKF